MTTVAEDLLNSIQAAYDERARLLHAAEMTTVRIKRLQAEHGVASNPPTWKNTLKNDGRVSGDAFSRMASELGYKYTLWNDRIYHVDHDAENNDTGLTVEYLERT
jgi:hypothetical protein